jgi:hypothetical protein
MKNLINQFELTVTKNNDVSKSLYIKKEEYDLIKNGNSLLSEFILNLDNVKEVELNHFHFKKIDSLSDKIDCITYPFGDDIPYSIDIIETKFIK